jgi:glycosyltransferase involved in cell wall biosynthesis
MKIVMVSMPTLHFFRWTDQLKNAGHDVFWFDISGMSPNVEKLNWVNQYTNWKLKFNYPGRTFLKKSFPKLYNTVNRFNKHNTQTVFEKYLNKVQPDVVHSFALYVSCTPIYDVMMKHKNVKWIYSSWGSDLFYFQNIPEYLKDIKKVLPRIDFLFTDCNRDFEIAKTYGFKGKFLGVFPGGGGFNLENIESYHKPLKDKNTILLKGFQGRSGRALTILKAIEKLKNALKDYEIIVFGSGVEVVEYYNNSKLKSWKNFKVLGRINHNDVLKLMGKALIYIGNSNSDGMPNTLLEAIISGAFPIQSNPGNATAEIIEHAKNGFLIQDYKNKKEIESLITEAINNQNIIESAYTYNQSKIKPNLDRQNIIQEVLKKYSVIIN